MISFKSIMHVTLTIAPGPEAFQQARNFYVNLLGLEELDRPAETDGGQPGFWLAFGSGQQIHLSAEPNPENYNAPSKRHAALQVNSLEEVKQTLANAGVEIDLPDHQIGGMRRMFARDPWGNRLELVELL